MKPAIFPLCRDKRLGIRIIPMIVKIHDRRIVAHHGVKIDDFFNRPTGIVGHKLIPASIKKISDLKNKLKYYPNILIEIDGGVTFESAPVMVKAGANMLVCGSSTIFKPNQLINTKIIELKQLLKKR